MTTEVDTSVGDVYEATARAVHQALSVGPSLFAGFGDAQMMASWLRDRIGHRLLEVTEAAPDLLADAVGRRLTDAAVILGPFDRPACAGLLLRLEGITIAIGTLGDEWVLALDQPPAHLAPYWRIGPWIAHA